MGCTEPYVELSRTFFFFSPYAWRGDERRGDYLFGLGLCKYPTYLRTTVSILLILYVVLDLSFFFCFFHTGREDRVG